MTRTPTQSRFVASVAIRRIAAAVLAIVNPGDRAVLPDRPRPSAPAESGAAGKRHIGLPFAAGSHAITEGFERIRAGLATL